MSDNIITLQTMETELLPLVSFRREETLWPRHQLNPARVREMVALYQAEGPTALPPLVVARVGGRLYLVHGWHRCAAAEEAGLSRLPAVLIDLARREYVYLEALTPAATTDQPLTRAEKRAVVDRLLAEHPGYSDRCIARLAGVSQPFVSARRRLSEKPDARPHPPARSATGRAADELVQAARQLARLQDNLRQYHDDRAVAPGPEIGAAVRRSCRRHQNEADALLTRMRGWLTTALPSPAEAAAGERASR